MAIVAFLETYALGDPDSFPYREWRSLAQERGIEIKGHLVRGENDREAYQTAHQLVEDADALIMTTSSFLHDPSLVSLITARVQSGVPILVKPTPPADPKIRAFLAQFDIEPTDIGVFDPEAAPARDSLSLTLERLRDPASFRDSQLFAGVNKLVVVQAQVVRCGSRSFPLLVVPEERAAVVELSTDLPPDWVGRELTCMAAFSPSGETVIVISGSILTDRLIGPKSLEWPGENANRRFALNLLDRLVRGQQSRPEADLGYQLCRQIEHALMELLESALGSPLDEWWFERVPLPIRQKCAQRREEEQGRYPIQAYLDLTDLKQIIEHNWKVFEPAVRDAGWQGGKSQALSWFGRVNEVRRLVMHPLKAHVSQATLTTAEVAFLQDCRNRIVSGARALRRGTRGTDG